VRVQGVVRFWRVRYWQAGQQTRCGDAGSYCVHRLKKCRGSEPNMCAGCWHWRGAPKPELLAGVRPHPEHAIAAHYACAPGRRLHCSRPVASTAPLKILAHCRPRSLGPGPAAGTSPHL
jgi:hypothetical protein